MGRKIKHGLSSHPLYRVWAGMKARCYNKNSKIYEYYGRRGIKICNEWINNPTDFIFWGLKNGYKLGLDIDRINNNGDYTPDNCRFTTRKININNRGIFKTKPREIPKDFNLDQLINWRALSRFLIGGSEGIRSNAIPKKHQEKVEKLRTFIKGWMEQQEKENKQRSLIKGWMRPE